MGFCEGLQSEGATDVFYRLHLDVQVRNLAKMSYFVSNIIL